MTEAYSYRPYKPGDEAAINDLYYKVTGRRRTAAQFAWQWLEAPEGQGDIWLIEATDEEGNVKLIGHHGVMPIAFSHGEIDLLFGKTENTMVLPEYRKKILYPRFEKRFIKAYSGRYDALFSTMGPAAAIRQRKAMGYEFPAEWHSERYSATVGAEFLFLASFLKEKVFHKYGHRRSVRNNTNRYKKLIRVGLLSSEDAATSEFFDDFWEMARVNFSIAPSRRKEDLTWRFWSNPYKNYLTLVVDESGVKGYCIVSLSPSSTREVFLEDFCVHSNSSDEAESVFDKLIRSLNRAGFYSLLVVHTKDSVLFNYGFLHNKAMFLSRLNKQCKRTSSKNFNFMPRKITSNGMCSQIKPWDITGIVLEGRA